MTKNIWKTVLNISYIKLLTIKVAYAIIWYGQQNKNIRMVIMKTNREIIEEKIKTLHEKDVELYGIGETEYKIGCYDKDIDKLSKQQLKILTDAISLGDYTDVDVKIKRIDYVVEISYVDEEIDFIMKSRQDYIDTYGDERYL